MSETGNKIWFPAKRYGWGWGIANCWQGLLIQIGYGVLLVASARILLPRGQKTEFWCLFVGIHWLKGEKPKWSWGE